MPPESAEVLRLIELGHSKNALEAAKALHKRVGTAASEALLVRTYAARAQSMRERRLEAEADALVAMVREKFPRSASLLKTASSGGNSMADLVQPLADPACPAETRAAIERRLRAVLDDPGELAACSALPANHPLRVAAAAVASAFASVTSGMVEDEAIALPDISHRGPLGPWKLLVRAIASFHRGDDEACERNLASIDPESVPARLAPVLRAMISGTGREALEPAAAELAMRIGGDLTSLRKALREASDRIQDGPEKAALQAI